MYNKNIFDRNIDVRKIYMYDRNIYVWNICGKNIYDRYDANPSIRKVAVAVAPPKCPFSL